MATADTMNTNRGAECALDCCHRCGGLLVSDLSTDTGIEEWHCVICGDRVDHVILAHRQQYEAPQEAERVFAGSVQARSHNEDISRIPVERSGGIKRDAGVVRSARLSFFCLRRWSVPGACGATPDRMRFG